MRWIELFVMIVCLLVGIGPSSFYPNSLVKYNFKNGKQLKVSQYYPREMKKVSTTFIGFTNCNCLAIVRTSNGLISWATYRGSFVKTSTSVYNWHRKLLPRSTTSCSAMYAMFHSLDCHFSLNNYVHQLALAFLSLQYTQTRQPPHHCLITPLDCRTFILIGTPPFRLSTREKRLRSLCHVDLVIFSVSPVSPHLYTGLRCIPAALSL